MSSENLQTKVSITSRVVKEAKLALQCRAPKMEAEAVYYSLENNICLAKIQALRQSKSTSSAVSSPA